MQSSTPAAGTVLRIGTRGSPLALLAGGFAVTFASAVMGSAVMRLGRD